MRQTICTQNDTGTLTQNAKVLQGLQEGAEGCAPGKTRGGGGDGRTLATMFLIC